LTACVSNPRLSELERRSLYKAPLETDMPVSVRAVWFAFVAVLAAASSAAAHHSFAMFDSEHQVRLVGTVSKFQWTNPHIYIDLDYVHDGQAKRYVIEGASISILKREGWTFNMLKPGDKITVVIAPLRDNQPGGLLKQIMLSDGRKLGNGGAAGKPNIPID